MHERKSLDFLEESINRNRDLKGSTGESIEGKVKSTIKFLLS